jgi:hypothetical protein
MVSRYSLLLVALGVCLAVPPWFEGAASSADDKNSSAEKTAEGERPSGKKIAMQTFMRKKLEASQSLIEGLVLEDFDLIANGARQLKTTSSAAQFLVIHDPIYTGQADEFRRIIDKMEKAAKEKRIDGATLAYMDMTMSCVECHKYVRNVLVAQ